jgi:hypothetical protein
MLQVSPITIHRISMHSANVVMGPQHRTGETLQNYAESTGRDIKAAGLEPDTVRIRNPEAVIIKFDVGDKMFTAPSIRIEAVCETVESNDRHLCLLV